MTTAFVLSGGGNLGAVQVGMLRALVEHGERPDMIIGTSVGAVNGSWLASGSEVEDVDHLAAIWEGISRRDIFPLDFVGGFLGFVGRRDHLVANTNLRRLLERELRFARLEDAPIPLTVIATDVLTGREAAFANGDAVETILASAAIPGVFPAVEIEGRSHVDGGVVNDTPVSHAVASGADTIWALPTGFASADETPPRGALGMMLHAIGIMSSQRLVTDIERYRDHVDLRVVPPPNGLDVSPTDFSRGDELLDAGYSRARAWLELGAPPVHAEVALQS